MNTYPIVNGWAKGCYLARITGPHKEYTYDREFLQGTPRRARGTLEYEPGRDLDREPEGFYVMRAGKHDLTHLLELSPIGWTDHGTDYTPAEILAIWREGWDGQRCECSRPIIGGQCADEDAHQRARDANVLAGTKAEPF